MSLTLPPNAPFTGTQRMWLKGYLAGLSSSFTPAAPAPAVPAPAAGPPVHILWGSQTGNAEGLAKRLSKTLQAKGHRVTVADMAGLVPADLAAMEHLVVITSTYGDGEPPDNAADLHAALAEAGGGPLSALRFAVFALGDSNYPDFCKCGHDFHSRLAGLGASPLLDVAETDVDFDAPFAAFGIRIAERLAAGIPA